MLDGILWLITNTAMGFYNIGAAFSRPALWLDWTDPQAIMRFAYYGGSVEFFFAVFALVLVLTAVGLYHRPVLWGFVRGAETFGNSVGRFFAWAGLLMVLQQTLIVFLQRIFLVSEISLGPFGSVFTKSLSWYSEELKLYNAMIVAMCCAYTFIQGGHVRVDLFYGGASRRTKKIIDMVGSLIFMMPVLILTWMYAWFFLWRHLITPKISASDTIDALLRKARVLKWNVETYSFSPNGFNGYFLFKVLIVAFVAMMLVQALAFFFRNLLELIEGEEADGRFHDADVLGDPIAERTAEIH